MKHQQLDDAVIILALGLVPGIGNTRVNQTLNLLHCCGWPLSRLGRTDDETFLRKVLLQDPQVGMVLRQCKDTHFEEAAAHVKLAQMAGLQVVHILEESYPASLRIHLGQAAPPVLFFRGNSALAHQTAGAVVGTRAPTPRGIRAATEAATTTAAHATSLVSGGAAGIDTAAHDAAVTSGGNTVLLLPEGILSWTLPSHWRRAFDEGRIAIISACLPHAPWQTHAAVSRNALISAMAQFVCVVQPRKQGGSILTMRHAVHQQKPVFVEPLSALPASLRNQARSLRTLATVLPGLDLEHMRRNPETADNQGQLF